MKQNFELNETELLEESIVNQIQTAELNIRTWSDKRQLLRSVLDKIKSQRPEGYVEKVPTKKMFSENFKENKSIAARINFILNEQKEPMSSSEITEKYISLLPSSGGKKKEHTLKNISTVLSIGNKKKYEREEKNGRYIYKIKDLQTA